MTIGTASKSAEKTDKKEKRDKKDKKGKSKDKDLLSHNSKKTGTGEKVSARRLKTRSLDLKGGAGKKFMAATNTRLDKLENYMQDRFNWTSALSPKKAAEDKNKKFSERKVENV